MLMMRLRRRKKDYDIYSGWMDWKKKKVKELS
jgi:hypothetical protein